MKKFLSLILSLVLMLSVCAAASADYTVSAPKGAPALALAVLAAENPDNYWFVAAENIAAEFAKNEADFVIAPVNAGAKLFKADKSTYQLAAVVSWGNLYFASQKANFTPADINGADIVLFGENTINSSVVLYALEQNGIVPASVEYLGSAAATQALLISDDSVIVVTAEPALTAANIKLGGTITGYSVNDLYKAATGFDGFTQAALFVKAETAQKDPEGVKAFLAQVEASCAMATTDVEAVAAAAVALEILPNQKVAVSAIPNCAIRYLNAAEAREQIEATANIDLSQFGGALPADEFYYVAE